MMVFESPHTATTAVAPSYGSSAEADYARYNTVYMIGQYLCWAEILRREAQLLEPLHRERDQEIMVAMEKVRYIMADSISNTDPVLRVFRGDQRAIGEVLLTTIDATANRIGPRWDCLGYAAFVEAVVDQVPGIMRWIRPLLDDVGELAADYRRHEVRVVALQHDLVALVNLIDPDGERIPTNLRELL